MNTEKNEECLKYIEDYKKRYWIIELSQSDKQKIMYDYAIKTVCEWIEFKPIEDYK